MTAESEGEKFLKIGQHLPQLNRGLFFLMKHGIYNGLFFLDQKIWHRRSSLLASREIYMYLFYTVNQKKVDRFYFCDNFGKCGPVFIVFQLLNLKRSADGSAGVKTRPTAQWLKWFCEAAGGGAHLTKPGWSKPPTHSNPTNLALFRHKITLYRFNQGAHTIAGGLKWEQGGGRAPPPHFNHWPTLDISCNV